MIRHPFQIQIVVEKRLDCVMADRTNQSWIYDDARYNGDAHLI